MAKKELRKMNRKELIEVIYALQQQEKDFETGDVKQEQEDDKNPIYEDLPSEETVAAELERRKYRKRYLRTLKNTIYALVVVAAVAVLIATVFIPVFHVSGESMEPTLEDDDIIVLIKTGDFEPGDVVGFYYQSKLLLKRVIGEPGDIIDIDEEGNVTVNGEALDEPYLSEKSLGETDIDYPYQVPENRYFVMGDNRAVSIDSRRSDIGCIDADQIVGKALFKVWPLERISRI